MVYSKDENTGEVGLKRVKRVFESKVHTIYTIHLGEEEEIQTTNYHPFYEKDKGWVCAIQLQEGDELCTIKRDTKEITSIEKKRVEEGIFVYNFEVEHCASYFISSLGIYVHNKRCGKPKRSKNPPARRVKLKSRKEAYEAAKRAGHGKKQ